MAFSRRFVAPLASESHLCSIQAGIVNRFLKQKEIDKENQWMKKMFTEVIS
jgi:hypothetical protein